MNLSFEQVTITGLLLFSISSLLVPRARVIFSVLASGSSEFGPLKTYLYPSGKSGKSVGAALVASIGSLLYVTLLPTVFPVALSTYLILPNLV